MADVPSVYPGQVWEDNDWRAKGRLVLILSVPSLDVPDPGEVSVTVEVVRSRDGASGREDVRARGRRRAIKLRRFKPTSTGYRLTSLTPADVS